MNLGYWLRKSPQPVAVMADDKRIEVVRNGRGWRELVNTIKALEPSKVTCVDSSGNVIRTVVLDSEDDEKKSGAAASPEMSDVQLFAKLISEAYEKGMTANQPIVENAMQFVERQGQRLLKAETEIERLRAHIHKLNLQIAELSNVPMPAADDGIVSSLVAGVMQAHAQQAQPQPQPQSQITAIKGAKK